MRPQANFLLTFGRQVFAIGYVAHIADHQGADTALFSPLDHGTATFVFQVAGTTALLRQEARFAPLQSFPPPGPFALAVLFGAELRQPLGGILLIGPQRAAGDDDRFLAISEGCGMDFAQVASAYCFPWGWRCLTSILDHQMPSVVTGGPVPHQPYFHESPLGQSEQVGMQRDLDGGQAACPGQEQPATFQTDARTFPDGRAKMLALMRILHVQPKLSAGFGRLACSIEALLRRIPAMGVQGGWPAQGILHPLAALLREPDALLAIAAVMLHPDKLVKSPTFCI